MKLDDWGFRKNNSSKPNRVIKTQSQKSSKHQQRAKTSREDSIVSAVSERSNFSSDNDHIVFPDGCRIPKSPMKVSKLMALIPSHSKYTGEILLVKWQGGGEYLRALLLLMDDVGSANWLWTPTVLDNRGENLLMLIQRKTLPYEQEALIKAFLHESLISLSPRSSPWTINWVAACKATNWRDAKRLLLKNNAILDEAGENALRCALVIIAEYLLRTHQNRLEELRRSREPLTDEDLLKAADSRKEYMKIMKYFRGAGFDVDQSWYKYALIVTEWNETITYASHDAVRKRLDAVVEKEQKYRQLTASYTGLDEGNVDGYLDWLLRNEPGNVICPSNWRSSFNFPDKRIPF